jgi:hypothetical protein
MILMPIRSADGRAGGLASDQTVRHVSHGGIGTKQAVDHPVPPGAIAPPGGARDPLPGEPSLLQGLLLGDVARLDPCLDAVRGSMREQVTGEQALRLRAVTEALGLRQEHDADLPAVGAG